MKELTKEAIYEYLSSLAKPVGSLGRWEELAVELCWIQQTLKPEVRPAEFLVFVGDHGVAAEGVTLWPSTITTVMAEQIAAGGAVSAALSDEYGIRRRVIDVGIKYPARLQDSRLAVRPIRRGTDNLFHKPAMTLREFRECIDVGIDEARMANIRGTKILLVGEMGIGNTTSASCLARLLADVPIDELIGSGAGANESSLEKKKQVVETATDRVLQRCGYEVDEAGMAEVAGFEIAAMAGCMIQAAKQGQVVLLDGTIATAAALIARKLDSDVVRSMIACHVSSEPSHGKMLQSLGLKPMLDWSMRLGEGTGALALFPLLAGAAAWCQRTSRIEDLSVPE